MIENVETMQIQSFQFIFGFVIGLLEVIRFQWY